MNKKRLIVTSIISIILVSVLMIGSTYSIFTSSDIDEEANVYQTGNLNITYTLSSENVLLENSTPMSVEDSIQITPYRVTVTNNGTVPYMFDVILNVDTATEQIDSQYIMTQVGKIEPKLLSACTDNMIQEDVIVPAGSSVDIDVRVWVSDEVQNTEIGKSFFAKIMIDGIAIYEENSEIDNSMLIADVYIPANEPNLDSGNLIPVYYDTVNEIWKKADRTNANYSWYNYLKKEWANAILISDSATRTIYQNAEVGTEIPINDISAFYVWIPRFKYRVWNITRQAGDESTYGYLAYSTGIDIEFESGTSSTGNVECTYDVSTIESSTSTESEEEEDTSVSEGNLSDVCVYNGTDTITTTSNNLDYKDAWYTHPAFTLGSEEKTGFWIGKFETSGTATAPTVLPDQLPLTNQVLSSHFTSSKVFQTYGLSSSMDAHMLTNLEWGAVAYLTQSVYGLCDGKTCRDVYINNSSSCYTGRSGGSLAGSDTLKQVNVYSEASGTETADYKYKSSGYYTYQGYFIDYNGNVTSKQDVSKVASTTGNITGVYDMSGGAYEYVMGNMVDASTNFYPSLAGTSWNVSTTLDSKYYNSYSYGTEYYTQSAFNRARLGDATAEVIGSISTSGAWKSGSEIMGTFSTVVNETLSWFQRGGYYEAANSSIFNSSRNAGGATANDTFRSALS